MKRCAFGMAVFVAMSLVGAAWAGEDKNAEPQLRLELDLVDGSHIIGVPGIETVPVQTSYAKMEIPLKEILAIKMGEDHETVSMDLRNGDKLKGVVSLGPVGLSTVFGKASIGMEHIRELHVVLTAGVLPRDLLNVARRARAEVNRSSPGNGSPEKVNDGVTEDVGQGYTSYWFAGELQPKPDWLRLQFEKPAEVYSIRILLPIGTARFAAGHAPVDYEVVGLNRGQRTVLASVKNENHPKAEPGPIPTTQWIVVRLAAPQLMDGVQLTCEQTSGAHHGPVVFEMEVMGRPASEVPVRF